MLYNIINLVIFVSSFVSLVVKYLNHGCHQRNHKVHKDFHKGHKEECQVIGGWQYIF